MSRNRKAPALIKREGFDCQLAGDTEANSTTSIRLQFLVRAGLSINRAALLSSIAFGEGCAHG